MQIRIALVPLVLLVGCGGKQAAGPSGTGSAGGSAAAAPTAATTAAAYCLETGDENQLSAFVADDSSATFCVKRGDGDDAPKCTVVELATGAFRAAGAPPAPAVTDAAYAVKQDTSGVQVCKGEACKKLDLPKLSAEQLEGGAYEVSVSSDGKRVAVTGGGQPAVILLDGTTGKKLRTVKLAEDTCVEGAYLLGEVVHVATSVCAGPGGSAILYSFAGKRIGPVGSEEFNSYGARPIPVGGDRWALVHYSGGDVLVFDGKTGKQVHVIEVEAPEDCEQCDSVIGEAHSWSATAIAKLPSGKLATISGAGIAIIDPAAGKLEKTHRLPICPAQRTK
jgi:hypothetical protein